MCWVFYYNHTQYLSLEGKHFNVEFKVREVFINTNITYQHKYTKFTTLPFDKTQQKSCAIVTFVFCQI